MKNGWRKIVGWRKVSYMKKWVFALLVLAFAGVAGVVRAEPLRVVTLYAPPLAYEQDGEVAGIAADLVREGLRRMEMEAEIVIMPWKRALFSARYGEADAVFYAVKNPVREAWFFYPDEHLVRETTILLKRKGTHFEWRENERRYTDIRLGTGRGYYYGPDLKRFLETTKFRSVEEANTIDINFAKLLGGRIDAFLADRFLAQHFIRENASSGFVEVVSHPDGTPVILDSVKSYLAFSRKTTSRSMADAFTKVLREMRADGTYDAIVERYR